MGPIMPSFIARPIIRLCHSAPYVPTFRLSCNFSIHFRFYMSSPDAISHVSMGFWTDNLMPQSHGKDFLVMFNLTIQKRKPALRIQWGQVFYAGYLNSPSIVFASRFVKIALPFSFNFATSAKADTPTAIKYLEHQRTPSFWLRLGSRAATNHRGAWRSG